MSRTRKLPPELCSDALLQSGASKFSIHGWSRAAALGLPRLYTFQPHGPDLRRILRWLKWILPGALLFGVLTYELRTSALQSRVLSYYARQMSYSVEPGASSKIIFPKGGPFDAQRGYNRIAEFQQRLQANHYRVVEQARFSPHLARIASWGIAPPYREHAAPGLVISERFGAPAYRTSFQERLFGRFEEIPPLVVQALVYMENRELGDSSELYDNPVIEWDRLAKAGLLYAGYKLGLPVSKEGGSTLATQLEKYRHSAHGRTRTLAEKLQQMTGATLRVYREGRDTRTPRQEIVLDYLNTVPLAAAPYFGELHGLGDGLQGWFGMELRDVTRALRDRRATALRAEAFKHVLALLAAVRAPSFYLIQNRKALEARVSFYTRRLAEAGVLDAEFARRLEETPIRFATQVQRRTEPDFARHKAENALRTSLLEMLGVPTLYDLDRLHLDVRSTIDLGLQNEATQLFEKLRDPRFVAQKGLRGERLLEMGDPTKVIYSLVLYEKTPKGNALRVQTDNLDRPFDLNTGMKLELGSTAKLRTLAHYLELVSALYGELLPLDRDARAARAAAARDPITRWAAETLAAAEVRDLPAFLELALDRKYSASPGETFFTGGGIHVFGNFDPKDNGQNLPIREATRRSTNLVFIRLMRDLVRYHQARLPYDAEAVFADLSSPVRRRLLLEMADDESRQILLRSYRKYRGLEPAAVLGRFLGDGAASARSLAILYFASHPGARTSEAPAEALGAWLRERLPKVTDAQIQDAVKEYGNPKLTLLDYAYLLRRHTLDLFCAATLLESPAVGWNELWARSDGARKLASSWLLQTKHRGAQDVRLRIQIEKDAFARMTPYWKRLGFPFERLAPTYATAIGNSSDRPAALAELMGIVVNDGVRLPTVRFDEFRFAQGTPYHTVLEPQPPGGERVMAQPVASALRSVLAGVVEGGTARRMSGAFVDGTGASIPVGGKTGSGDNRRESFGRGGQVVASTVVNRTAAFTFYIGDSYFGVLLAYVSGEEAGGYKFTSALPVAILRLLAPAIRPRLVDGGMARFAASTPKPPVPPTPPMRAAFAPKRPLAAPDIEQADERPITH